MQKVIFVNSKGESIEIGVTPPFVLSKIDGLGDVEADNQSQRSPFQDGSMHIDSILAERFINMEISIFSSSATDLSNTRQRFSSIFNPKLGEGLFQYINGTTVREIKAIPEHVPQFLSGKENRVGNFQKAVVNLKCPNPYWKTQQITEEPTFEALFEFPFEGEFEMGIQRDQRIIINDGDSASPIQVEFYGPAINPIITNKTTGEYIKVNRTLAEGEYMRIDTTRGKKSVEFISQDGTATNVFNWIDLGSSFFQLIIGENEIEYSADSDIQGSIVNISYNKLYNAV